MGWHGVKCRTLGAATRKLEFIAHAEGRRYIININTGISTESIRIEYAIRDHLDERAMHFVPHVWGICERGNRAAGGRAD